MEANVPERNDDVRAALRSLISEVEALIATIGEEGAQRYRDAVNSLQRQIRRVRDDLDDPQYAAFRRAAVDRSAGRSGRPNEPGRGPRGGAASRLN